MDYLEVLEGTGAYFSGTKVIYSLKLKSINKYCSALHFTGDEMNELIQGQLSRLCSEKKKCYSFIIEVNGIFITFKGGTHTEAPPGV